MLLKDTVRIYDIIVLLCHIPHIFTTGLAGDNDLQNAEIGSIVDFIVDIGKNCENVMKETDEAKKVCACSSVDSRIK